jgi:hypothetical protein
VWVEFFIDYAIWMTFSPYKCFLNAIWGSIPLKRLFFFVQKITHDPGIVFSCEPPTPRLWHPLTNKQRNRVPIEWITLILSLQSQFRKKYQHQSYYSLHSSLCIGRIVAEGPVGRPGRSAYNPTNYAVFRHFEIK